MSERMKEWFSFRDDADTRTYVIAGVAGVAIVASLYFMFSGLFGGGGGLSVEERQELPVTFYCTKHKAMFDIPQKDLFLDLEVENDIDLINEPPHIRRINCPACNTKTGVMTVLCPNEECKKTYCPDWWQKAWSKTQFDVQKPLICPYCKTDREQYFIKSSRR